MTEPDEVRPLDQVAVYVTIAPRELGPPIPEEVDLAEFFDPLNLEWTESDANAACAAEEFGAWAIDE